MNQHDGYRSRKFWVTVSLSVTFTLLFGLGPLSEEGYVTLMGGLVLFFTAGNVGEKFIKG
ncbi:MAG: hypothetical protein E4H01_03930 [Lysobacterales bacterium]|nr:MAG: hypothetical protein E4H01_03930 [Xanthomonadales bacterium]